jgi:hypothetical protein
VKRRQKYLFLQDHKNIGVTRQEASFALKAGEEVRLNAYFLAIVSQRYLGLAASHSYFRRPKIP